MLLEYRKIGFTGESLKTEEKKKRTARPCFFLQNSELLFEVIPHLLGAKRRRRF